MTTVRLWIPDQVRDDERKLSNVRFPSLSGQLAPIRMNTRQSTNAVVQLFRSTTENRGVALVKTSTQAQPVTN
jgi:hypothetical protein